MGLVRVPVQWLIIVDPGKWVSFFPQNEIVDQKYIER